MTELTCKASVFWRTKFGHSLFRYPLIANMTKYSKVSICNWFYPVISYWLDSLPKIETWKLDSSWSAALAVSGNYLVGKERPRLVWQLGKGQGVSPLVIHPGLIPNIFLHFLLLSLETISLISSKFSTLFDLSVSLFRGIPWMSERTGSSLARSRATSAIWIMFFSSMSESSDEISCCVTKINDRELSVESDKSIDDSITVYQSIVLQTVSDDDSGLNPFHRWCSPSDIVQQAKNHPQKLVYWFKDEGPF